MATCTQTGAGTFLCDEPVNGTVTFTPTVDEFDADFESDADSSGFITDGNPGFLLNNGGDFSGKVDFEDSKTGIDSTTGHAFQLDNAAGTSSLVTISLANGVDIASRDAGGTFDAMRLQGDQLVVNVGTSIDGENAVISGADDGIVVNHLDTSLVINNYGQIEGGNQEDDTPTGFHEAILVAANGTPGQLVQGNVTINNYNQIVTNSAYDDANDRGGSAINISTSGVVNIDNKEDASIEGTQGGITVYGTGGTTGSAGSATNDVNIVNAGHIDGHDGAGIALFGVGDVTGSNSSMETLVGAVGLQVNGALSFDYDNSGGLIQGTDFDGLDLDNITNDIDFKNTGGQVLGFWDGIDIDNTGGSITIDNAGGFIQGGNGNPSTGAEGIDISDVVGASTDSITIINTGDGDDTTPDKGADSTITGSGHGIEIDNIDSIGYITVDNSLGGLISGDEDDGISIDGVNFEAGDSSLQILNNGDADSKGGTIFGEDDGVRIDDIEDGNIVINNSFGGSIKGGEEEGVQITDILDGDVTIDNTNGGTITGEGGDGVKIEEVDDEQGGGNVTVKNDTKGTITGYWDGVDIEDIDHDVTVTNQGGTITGQNAQGVDISDVWDGGVLVDNSKLGTILGGTDGVLIENIEGGLPGGLSGVTVDNSFGGAITGSDGDGVHIEEIDSDGAAGGTVTVLNNGDATTVGGKITGYWDGVDIEDVDHDVLVDNSFGGTITGQNAQGVDISDVWNGGVQVVNSNKGTISGLGEGVLIENIQGGVLGGFNGVLVDNTFGGSISGATGDGVHIEEIDEDGGFGGVVTVKNNGDATTAGGTITGYWDGVDIEDVDHDVTVNNTFGGTITGKNGQGVDISDVWDGNVLVDNSEGGQIDGLLGDGVAIDNINGTVTVLNVNSPDSIFGYWDGIDIEDVEEAVVIHNTKGSITGQNGQGIDLEDIDDNVTITNTDGKILGGDDGIRIEDIWTDTPTGLVLVDNKGTGSITGENGDGVKIEEVDGLDVDVFNEGTITGYWDGVDIEDIDDGIVTVTNAATGTITGTNASALDIESDENIFVENSGALRGLGEDNDTAVVRLDSLDGAFLNNYAGGTIQSHDGAWDAAAIFTFTNDGALINNEGTITGTITTLGGEADIVNNLAGGVWNTSGVSFFGFGDDLVFNQGTVNVQDEAFLIWLNLFDNDDGIIEMTDGDTDDFLFLGSFFNDEGVGDYVGNGNARLGIDVHFGQDDDPDTGADFLFAGGDIEGSTGLVINAINSSSGGINEEGIDFAEYGDWTPGCSGPDGLCADGETFYIHGDTPNSFKIGDFTGVADGFVGWFVRHDEEWQDYELVSTFVAPAGLNAPGIITGAQHIWYETYDVVSDHSYGHQFAQPGGSGADLPVAVYEEAPAPVGDRSAIWAKVSGTWIEHDAEVDVEPFGSVSTDADQSIFSILAGADMKPWGEDDPWRFGIFGGYVNSQLDFDLGDAEAEYEGGVIGAYGAYNNGAWYADLTVKGDILNVDYDVGGLETDANLYNIGVAGNVGYRFYVGPGFIEPVASLAYVHSDIDDMDDSGTTVSFSEADSLRGGVGARLGTTFAGWGWGTTELSLLGKVWNEFEDENEVTLSDGFGNTASFSQDIGGVFGEVSATAVMTSTDGSLSGLLTVGGQFGENFNAWSAKAGVRKGF